MARSLRGTKRVRVCVSGPVSHPAWRLTVRLPGGPQSYRFRRPEAAEEILLGHAASLPADLRIPRPDEVEALTGPRSMKGRGWELEYAPISQEEFLSMPLSGL